MFDRSQVLLLLAGILFSVLVIVENTQAQESMSLEQARQLALSSSEDLKIKTNEVERREAQYREALGSVLPQIGAEARWQKYFKSPVFFGNTVPIDYQLESGVSVQQTLWAFGRVSSALKAARIGKKIGKFDRTAARQDIVYQASMAYYSSLLAAEQLRISQQTLQNAKDNLAILNRKFSGGRPPQGDLVRLRSDVSARTAQVMAAEADYKEALLNLGQVTGRTDLEDVKLVTSFDSEFKTLNEEDLHKKLTQEQPRLEALKQQVEFNSEVTQVYKAADLPTLSLFGNYSYSGAGDQANIGSSNLEDSASAGLALTWNLWDGGQTGAQYRQAVVDKANAELTLAKTLRFLKLQLETSLIQYRTLVASHKTSVEAVSLAEKSFKIAQNRFRTGQASVTEVNSSEAGLTQARLGLSLNTYNIHASLAAIENIVTQPQGDLQ